MSVTVKLSIPNISCGHCTKTVMRETKDLPGVENVEADVETKSRDVYAGKRSRPFTRQGNPGRNRVSGGQLTTSENGQHKDTKGAACIALCLCAFVLTVLSSQV